jgi:hypothetical protein
MVAQIIKPRTNMTFDFFAREWFGQCGACGTELFAPTKNEYLMNYSKHTHSDKCLGGY